MPNDFFKAQTSHSRFVNAKTDAALFKAKRLAKEIIEAKYHTPEDIADHKFHSFFVYSLMVEYTKQAITTRQMEEILNFLNKAIEYYRVSEDRINAAIKTKRIKN